MSYPSLEACLIDLEKAGHLIRIKEEVDPNLEMAAIHLRVYEMGGPAILFENVKGSKFRAVSNLFGTLERSKFIFRKSLPAVKKLIKLRANPLEAIKHPIDNFTAGLAAIKALPLKNQVYTEDIDKPGIFNANLGMYRIQLTGNDYELDKEIGLHYQLHRGIGVHQTKANKKGQPLKVSCFIGGPPSHSVAAVMPLPEGISEMTFAGLLGSRRFRYAYKDGFCVSTDADFVITGEVYPHENKPEGPFGDHLGYYSLQHTFPLMRVHKVYAKKDAIWAFTVVGRPPQEDTSFGQLIHEITGDAIPQEIPGLHSVHAVDAAGVHPLLLAVGSERYTPYTPAQQPAELLTIANHILGTGQLSLAKFLFITGSATQKIDAQDTLSFMTYLLERINFTRDIHFHTHTTMDTLDYSGTGINSGSKVVLAAYGDKIRDLSNEVPTVLNKLEGFGAAGLAMPGVVCLTAPAYTNAQDAASQMNALDAQLSNTPLEGIAIIVICDDAGFTAQTLNNYLWVTYTRSNPSHDIYGIGAFTQNKHWGCTGPLVIDARIKPHHAPVLIKDEAVEKRVDQLFEKGGSLYSLISTHV